MDNWQSDCIYIGQRNEYFKYTNMVAISFLFDYSQSDLILKQYLFQYCFYKEYIFLNNFKTVFLS